MTKPKQSISTAFYASLETALKNYHDPEWLGENSALGSPYFLGDRAGAHVSARARGNALRTLLQNGVAAIQGRNAERYRTILTLRYFEKNITVQAAMRKVSLGRNAFHLNRRKAIRALESAMVGLVHPSLRLETPPNVEDAFPRPVDLERLRRHLAAGEDVTILGEDGSGRSILAAQVVGESQRPVLWFTVRPGLNDSVQGFAFSLGLFAFTQGGSSLWLQLVAAQGSIGLETLSGQISYTMAHLAPPLLICIDDADVLDPVGNAEHAALIQLWDSLRSSATLVVIGRQELSHATHILQVQNLSETETKRFFAFCGIKMAADEVERIYQWTRGNLRLLRICCSTLTIAPEETSVFEPSNDTLVWKFLITNLLAALSETEQELLARLSVFRRPFPLDFPSGSEEFAACEALQERRILNIAGDGSGELIVFYRTYVYDSMRPEAARIFHSLAAESRSAYGEYASAIYHLLRAGRYEEVIDLWPIVKRQEMEQGQAISLFAAFRDILDAGSAPANIASVLAIYAADLGQFLGNIEQAKADIEGPIDTQLIFEPDRYEMKGRIANDLDQFGDAKEAFERALSRGDLLLESRLAHIHKGLAWMHLRQRDITHAERELDLAQFEIENMRGKLAYDQARFDDATKHYEAAQRLADDLGSRNAGAKTRLNLALAYAIQGRYADSLDLLDWVYELYETMARVAAMAGCRITMSVAHNLAGEHDRALACLDDANEKLSTVDEVAPWQIALIHQARAEALLGLGQLTAATIHVTMAIDADDIGVLPDAYRTYGEILARQKEWGQAKEALVNSVELAEQNDDRLLLAYAWRALGCLHVAQGNSDAAQHAGDTAIAMFASMRLPHEVERCRAVALGDHAA